MFNFSTLVLYGVLSLGIGYAVGNAQKFGILKFLFLLIFLIPAIYSVENKFYIIAMTSSFMVGFLYAHSYLLDDFFDNFFYYRRKWSETRASKEQDKQNTAHKKAKQGASREQAEADQEDFLKTREQEKKRRAEELRQQREAQKQKKAEQEAEENEQSTAGKPTVKSEKRSPQEILGLNKDFTQQELREAYRRESNRTHPDKWASKPQAIQDLMAQEQKMINWAYRQLKQS